MNYSVCLLVASCLGGETPGQVMARPVANTRQVTTVHKPAVTTSRYSQEYTATTGNCGGCGSCASSCCSRPGIFSRLMARLGLRNRHCCDSGCGSAPVQQNCCGCSERPFFGRLFGRSSCGGGCDTGCNNCCNSTTGVTGQPVAVAVAQAPAPQQNLALLPVVPKKPETVNNGDIKQQYMGKIGKADDYGWITGQLFYVHTEGGQWIVRYASIDQEDRYGGSVVLAPTLPMDGYKEGDLVTIQGDVINEKASRSLGGALYRAKNVALVQR